MLLLLLDASKTVVLGVIGADVMFASLFDYLRTNFDPCKTTLNEYSKQVHFIATKTLCLAQIIRHTCMYMQGDLCTLAPIGLLIVCCRTLKHIHRLQSCLI